MLEKIIKKDKNEELERILDEKQVDEQAKNLLQGILYKIEVAYKDYQKVKGIEQTEEQYVDKLILNIKKNCNKIKVVKVSQKLENEELQKELKKKKFYIGKDEIISYPIEEKLLYAIEKKSNNKKILNNKYEEATIAVSDIINIGKNIDRLEVLRDFNGWSWTTVKKEIENIDANIIYQCLQILYGKDFMDNWVQDKDGIIDYSEQMSNEGKKYGEETIKEIKKILVKIAIANDVKENKEFAEEISAKLEEVQEKAKKYENNRENIEKISEKRKQAMQQLSEIEKILGQKSKLKEEYEKRNKELPFEEKIFNIKTLKKELNDQKSKLFNEINEANYLLNPMNYMEEKIKIEQKQKILEASKLKPKQKEELVIEFIKYFLQCLNIKIEETKEQTEIFKLIYQFRYFVNIPFNLEESIKDVEKLEKNITKTEKILLKKAIESKVIVKIPIEIMKHLCETRIVLLEETYFKITTKEEKNYVQIFDENITEEKFEVKSVGKTKINKKIKIFI